MKYETEITLDLPRKRVIELFDDPDNLAKWQDGLKSFEHISGEPGQPGAKSRLFYDMGRRQVEMIETIEDRSMPDRFVATYEAKGVWNRVVNHFFEIDDDKTRWVSQSEFKFGGIMRVVSMFMRGAFIKQSQKFMDDFKRFAEQPSG